MTAEPEPLNKEPDLKDPATLAAHLRDCAQGMGVQADACGTRPTAMAGHPFPEQFYRRVADLLARAADFISPAAPAEKAAAANHLTGAAVAAESAWAGGDVPPPEKTRKK